MADAGTCPHAQCQRIVRPLLAAQIGFQKHAQCSLVAEFRHAFAIQFNVTPTER